MQYSPSPPFIPSIRSALVAPLLLWMGVCACSPEQPVMQAKSPAEQLPYGVWPSPGDFADQLKQAQQRGIDIDQIGLTGAAPLMVLSLPKASYDPSVVAGQSGEATGVSVIDAIRQDSMQVVVGSGFAASATSLEPVGLLVIGGQEISPLQPHGYTRLVLAAAGQIDVRHRSDYESNVAEFAMQLGPGIIERGELDISERDLQRPKFFRSFLGVCRDQWLVGVSLAPVNLRTLGQTLIEYIDERGLTCTDVVNMAGDHQAVFGLKTENRVLFHGDISSPRVSLLGFSHQH